MSLAAKVDETNALLRQALGHLGQLTAPPLEPHVPDNWTSMRDLAPAGAMLAVRNLLKPVPEPYWKHRYLTDDVLVACVCRRGHRFTAKGFHDCPCGRTFTWTGRKLYVIRDD